MPILLRKAFPYLAIALGLAALAWAVSFGTLPKADFTFDNATELKTIDSAQATGQPENRVINGLFEGLLRIMPPKDYDLENAGDSLVPMIPQPGCASSYSLSDDGRTYTFTLRPGLAWSDGSPLTSADFAWSWMRLLHPETGSEYAYQLYYVFGAEKYNKALVDVGDKVEVELVLNENGEPYRREPWQLFPRGRLVHGTLANILKTPAPKIPPGASDDDKSKIESRWKEEWIYLVDIKPARENGGVDWNAAGTMRAFSKAPEKSPGLYDGDVEKCHHCLFDFASQVGVLTPDPATLVVTLTNPTAYFNELAAFYPLYPVNRACIEQHGSPDWTRPENIVSNGPFTLQFRRLRDRIRMVKNPLYWDAENVRLNVVDVVANKSETTSLNMFLTGQIDWATTAPGMMIPDIKEKLPTQWRSAPMLTTYIYRLNVTRPPLNNVKVRRALNLAMDKKTICEHVTKAGQLPARNFVPPGMTGYTGPLGPEYNVQEARRLLAEAGHPEGRGLPTIQILYNANNDDHEAIAQVVQRQWKEHLKIDVELRKLEWGVFLDSLSKLDYQVARSGWIADYPDPITFLDMWVTGGPQNQTGWSNPRYDALIEDSRSERDPQRRLEILAEAEALFNEEQPIIPIYWYVSKNLVQPRVKGFFNNYQDVHPLNLIWIDETAK